jgi:polysaccharide pyruvyl transferase WcaK-like protein
MNMNISLPHYSKQVGPLLGSAARRVFSKPVPKPTGYMGWIGHKNLGDEALYAAIQSLLHPLPLMAFSSAQESILERVSLGGKHHFQGVLLGGGTIIGPAYAVPVRRTLNLRLPMATFGTGVGSAGFGNAEYPEIGEWRSMLDRFEMIGVRGWRSYEALTELGVKNVEVIGDPALSLGPSSLPQVRAKSTLVINLAGNVGDKYGIGSCDCYREIAAIAKQHVAQGGELLPVALGPGDSGFLRDLLVDAGLGNHSILQPRTHDEYLAHISGAQWLIGVRLHSAVLASVVGTVPILVSYRNKCRDFMESVDLAHLAVKFDAEAGPLIRSAFESAQSQPELRNLIFDKVQHWRSEQRSYANRVMASFSN